MCSSGNFFAQVVEIVVRLSVQELVVILCCFSHPAPVIKPLPFGSSIPETWFPVDRDHEYEIIAVDPGKLEYHLVASAFHETVPTSEANINDVFRIQNAFLWHKYVR